MKRYLLAALAALTLLFIPATAQARPGEVNSCGSAYAVKLVSVNETTSCGLGKAAAKRISYAPVEYDYIMVRSPATGKTYKLSFFRRGYKEWFIYNNKLHIEIHLMMHKAGG